MLRLVYTHSRLFMTIEASELMPSVLSMVAKLYPNGTTLTVVDGQVEVSLPQLPAVSNKLVLPQLKSKSVTPIVKNQKSESLNINDGVIDWDGERTFALSSSDNGLVEIDLVVTDEQLDYLIETLRPEAGQTDDLELQVKPIYENDKILYVEYIDSY
jgi:hypothetical protein